MIRISAFLILVLCFQNYSFGQELDTIKPITTIKIDSIPVKASVFDTTATDINNGHSPKKAGTLSAILPGAGQAYNKKYWKMPIVYGTFAFLGYNMQQTQSRYADLRNAYRIRTATPAPTDNIPFPQIPTDQLQLLRDKARRNRDLSIVSLAAFYGIQILDAVVDAHLYDFDISDDLSLKFQPGFEMVGFSAKPQINLFSLTWKL